MHACAVRVCVCVITRLLYHQHPPHPNPCIIIGFARQGAGSVHPCCFKSAARAHPPGRQGRPETPTRAKPPRVVRTDPEACSKPVVRFGTPVLAAPQHATCTAAHEKQSQICSNTSNVAARSVAGQLNRRLRRQACDRPRSGAQTSTSGSHWATSLEGRSPGLPSTPPAREGARLVSCGGTHR